MLPLTFDAVIRLTVASNSLWVLVLVVPANSPKPLGQYVQ